MNEKKRTVIAKGSKSFFLASLFFASETRDACWTLYRWCRNCDDRIDRGGSSEALAELRTLTARGLNEQQGPDEFAELGQICEKYAIPRSYPEELLNGFDKDIRGVSIQSLEELEEYAYQVAGVVGLMMSHIMGAKMPIAIQPAKCLGNAMQLTNIARDVREDFDNNRVYLPSQWLTAEGIDPRSLMAPEQRARVFSVVTKVLKRSEDLYEEGYDGLKYLPLRAAVAVSIAGSIYSRIGQKILNKGPLALDERVFVSFPEKLLLTIEGIARVLVRMPDRWSMRRFGADTQ